MYILQKYVRILHTIESMLPGSLDGMGVWGRMDICIGMAETCCCPPGTITTLLISYTSIQNIYFLKSQKKKVCV